MAEVTVAKDGTLKIDRIVVAVDCGQVVNPDMLEAQVQGAPRPWPRALLALQVRHDWACHAPVMAWHQDNKQIPGRGQHYPACSTEC